MTMFVNKYLGFLLFPLFALEAYAATNDKEVDAFSLQDNMMCALHGQHIDFVDWSDINHPQKVSTLRIKPSKEGEMYINDVALIKDYAYVAIEDEGISVIDIRKKNDPKEIKFIPIDYSAAVSMHVDSLQYLKSQDGLLYIFVDMPTKGYHYVYLLDIMAPFMPKIFNLYDWTSYVAPFVSYPNYKEYKQYRQLSDISPKFSGYYISKTGFQEENGQVEMRIYGNPKKQEARIPLNIDGIKREKYEDPVTQAKNDFAIATYGNRLWIVDLHEAKILYKKDFDFKIRLIEFNGSTALIHNTESPDGYFLIDAKASVAAIPWKHKYTTAFMMSNSLLIVKNIRGKIKKSIDTLRFNRVKTESNELTGYNISDIKAVKQVPLPFSSWGKEMKWILKSDNLLLGCRWDDGLNTGSVTIADCRDANHPKLRGSIKGVYAGPKGFHIQDNRLYILDTGSPNINDENWAPNSGIPRVIDISDLDKPVIKSSYTLNR